MSWKNERFTSCVTTVNPSETAARIPAEWSKWWVGIDDVLQRLVGLQLAGALDDRQRTCLTLGHLDKRQILIELNEYAMVRLPGQMPDPGGDLLPPPR